MFLLKSFLAMPEKEERSTRSVNRKSRIANYLNHLNQAEQDVEKATYEAEEPFAKYKDWEDFVRIAISTQILEKGKKGDRVRITDRQGKEIFSAENDKGHIFGSKHKDNDFHRAMRRVDERAREHGAAHGKRHHGTEARRHRREPEANADEAHREKDENENEPGVRRRRHQNGGTTDDNAREQTVRTRHQREEEGFVYGPPPSRSPLRRGVRDLSPNRPPDLEAGVPHSQATNSVNIRTDTRPAAYGANLRPSDNPIRPHSRAHSRASSRDAEQPPQNFPQHENSQNSAHEIILPAPPPLIIEVPAQPSTASRRLPPPATVPDQDSRRSRSRESTRSSSGSSQASPHAANVASSRHSNRRPDHLRSVPEEPANVDRHEVWREGNVAEGRGHRRERSRRRDTLIGQPPLVAEEPAGEEDDDSENWWQWSRERGWYHGGLRPERWRLILPA